MEKKQKLKHVLEFYDFLEHEKHKDYYNNIYVKNQHEGAEYCCVMLEPKIKIYGIHKTDNSRSETGKPHFHIFTEFGETEFYFTVKPYTITYKDGFKLSDEYIENLDKKLLTFCELTKGSTYYAGIYTSWYFENDK